MTYGAAGVQCLDDLCLFHDLLDWLFVLGSLNSLGNSLKTRIVKTARILVGGHKTEKNAQDNNVN